MAEPLLVRAVYKFKGTNNDEVKIALCNPSDDSIDIYV